MSTYREYINGVEGVSPGNTATARLVMGRRYHRLKIFASAETTAETPVAVFGADVIDGIVLNATTGKGNVQLLDLTAADFIKEAVINGLTPAAGIGEIPLHFAEPKRATVIEEVATAFDTYDLLGATLKFKVKTGIQNVVVKILAVFDYGYTTDNGQRVINFIKKSKLNFTVGAGVFPLTTIPADYPIQRLFFDGPSAINSIEVKADSVPRHEATVAENNAILEDYGFAPGQYKYELVFDENQRLTGALIVLKDLIVRVNSAAAQSIDVIVHQRVPAYV